MTRPATALSASANSLTEAASMAGELDSLRLLLVRAGEALGTGDALQVQQACNELASRAVNLRPAFAELFPPRPGGLPVESEQQRRRLFQPLLEARAFYRAALRRWRRSLALRRALLEMQNATAGYEEAEVSRWY